MTTVNTTVERMIRNYPSIFGCRTDALHHLLCVNGNGYEWVGGGLVPDVVEPDRDLSESLEDEPPVVARYISLVTQRDSAEALEPISEILRGVLAVRRSNAQMRFRHDNADMLALVPWSHNPRASETYLYTVSPKSIYPLCTHACLCHVPDDVQPDWLAAVREMIWHIFHAPIRQARGRWTREYTIREYTENTRIAKDVLLELRRRFGSAGECHDFSRWADDSR